MDHVCIYLVVNDCNESELKFMEKRFIFIGIVAMFFLLVIVDVRAGIVDPGWDPVTTEAGNSQLNGIKITVNNSDILLYNVSKFAGSTGTRFAVALTNGTIIGQATISGSIGL